MPVQRGMHLLSSGPLPFLFTFPLAYLPYHPEMDGREES